MKQLSLKEIKNEIAKAKINGTFGPFAKEEYGTFIQEFDDFLLRNHIKRSYFYELKLRNKSRNLQDFFSTNIPENYLDCAFVFEHSTQGWKYWNAMNDLWLVTLNTIRKPKL